MCTQRAIPAITVSAISLIVLTGCTGRTASPAPMAISVSAPSSGYLVISRPEILRAAAGKSVMAVIQELRPTWLAARGGDLSTSVDGAPPTDLSLLASVRAADVAEIRLIRASHAAARMRLTDRGAVVSADMITVLTRFQ